MDNPETQEKQDTRRHTTKTNKAISTQQIKKISNMDNYLFLAYICIAFTLHLNIVYDILVSIYNYHDETLCYLISLVPSTTL
jgi:cell division protein FtsL